MKFTKRTYRRARYLAIKRIMEAEHLIDWVQASKDFDNWADLVKLYKKELDLGFRIVARGAREKGLWDFG